MVQKVRDRIIGALIMTCSGIAVSLITIFAQNNNEKAKNIKIEIDSKLSKTDFDKYVTGHAVKHNEQNENTSNQIKGLKEAILVIVELKLTKVEVDRLRSELNKKAKNNND